MIANFKIFGLEHIISILIPCFLGLAFIFCGLKTKSEAARKSIRLLLAFLIVAIRAARYVMDIYYGRFELLSLFSLHICHIDMILLIICLIKPRKVLFNFVFLIGIPMGLAVALFPGTNHPIPGIPRAIFFIMSHMMLVVGAVYLLAVDCMKVSFKYFIRYIAAGNVGLFIIFIINKVLGTNFLYIMKAPDDTVIKALENIFEWPGYVFAMDAFAIVLMLVMLLISQLNFGPWIKHTCCVKGGK